MFRAVEQVAQQMWGCRHCMSPNSLSRKAKHVFPTDTEHSSKQEAYRWSHHGPSLLPVSSPRDMISAIAGLGCLLAALEATAPLQLLVFGAPHAQVHADTLTHWPSQLILTPSTHTPCMHVCAQQSQSPRKSTLIVPFHVHLTPFMPSLFPHTYSFSTSPDPSLSLPLVLPILRLVHSHSYPTNIS